MPATDPTRPARFDVWLHDAHEAALSVGRVIVDPDPADLIDVGERWVLELAGPYGQVRLVAPTLEQLYQLADRAQYATGLRLATERGDEL